MDPREMAVSTGELAELRFLAIPEDSQGNKAHQVRDDLGTHPTQRLYQAVFAMNRRANRRAQVYHQKSHRKREDTVAKRGKAPDALSRQPVVGGFHLLIMRRRAEARNNCPGSTA